MVATAIKTSPKRSEKRRPTYPQLHQLILDNHGNLAHVAAECGYSTRSVEQWIKEANEVTRLGLFEAIGKGKAEGNRKRLLEIKTQRLKRSVPAFIIPSEIKALVSLHYRLTDAELNNLEIDQVLATYDTDPDKPRALKYKLTWAELGQELAKIEQMTIAVGGRNLNRWYLHVLLHWVGLGDESPVFDDYDYLPEITFKKHDNQDQREVYLKYIEPIVRLLIKRLEPYL